MWPLELLGAYFVGVVSKIFMFTLKIGDDDPIWLIFFRWVETTKKMILWRFVLLFVFDLKWKLNKWIEVNQSVAWLVTRVMNWTQISEHSKKNDLFVEAFRNSTDLWLWREPPLKRLEDWCWIGVTIQFATRYRAIFSSKADILFRYYFGTCFFQ